MDEELKKLFEQIVEHKKVRIEQDEIYIKTYEVYMGFRQAGFNEEQAFELLMVVVEASLKNY